MASDVVLLKLNDAMEGGTYLASVKEKSGLPISGMTGIILSDITPTARPAAEPTASPIFQLGMLLYSSRQIPLSDVIIAIFKYEILKYLMSMGWQVIWRI